MKKVKCENWSIEREIQHMVVLLRLFSLHDHNTNPDILSSFMWRRDFLLYITFTRCGILCLSLQLMLKMSLAYNLQFLNVANNTCRYQWNDQRFTNTKVRLMRGSLLILYSTLCADYVLDMIVVIEIVSVMEILVPIKHYDNESLTLS